MEQMVNNLFNNVKVQTGLVILIIIVALVIFAMTLYKKYKVGGKEAVLADLRETAYKLFLAAEKKYGPDTGPIKMSYAIKQFYILIAPDIVEKYISPNTVEIFLQDLFDNGYKTLKDYLDDGEVNNSTV